jgi:hypothetical protein
VNKLLRFLGVGTALVASSCSSSSNELSGPGHGTSGASSGSSGATGDADGAAGTGLGSNGSGGSLGITLGDGAANPGDCMATPEVCDGKDNDCDGIVDNVDANKDGVCDCLSIATVGHVGTWGMGNVFATWLNARTPKPAADLGDQVLTDELLAPFQVIVFLSTTTVDIGGMYGLIPKHHAFSDAEGQAFKKWIQAGGGAMATTGYNYSGNDEGANINKLFSTIGLTYKATGGITNFITNWMPHPVSMGVLKINSTNGVECSGDGTTVATTGTSIAMQVGQSGMGRAVMWGDEWITYDELWQDVQDEQVERLWLNIFKWLTPPKECQVPIPATVR